MLKTIEVTQDDINNGIPNSEHSCPVAIALKRVFPDRRVSVNEDSLMLYEEINEVCVRRIIKGTPSEVQAFILDFDDDVAVEPFSFEVDIPE